MEQKSSDTLSQIEWGVAKRASPGEVISGDLHIIKPLDNGILLAVVDGLGHGNEATAAARTAVQTLANYAHEPLISIVHRCHEALMSTRGAVMTIAFIDAAQRTVSWLGVGNVEGLLLRANPAATPSSEALLLRMGVLGYQISTMYGSVAAISPGDLLVFATDGISRDFSNHIIRGDSPKQIADRILEKSFKGSDDALVLAVRYLGRRDE